MITYSDAEAIDLGGSAIRYKLLCAKRQWHDDEHEGPHCYQCASPGQETESDDAIHLTIALCGRQKTVLAEKNSKIR